MNKYFVYNKLIYVYEEEHNELSLTHLLILFSVHQVVSQQ